VVIVSEGSSDLIDAGSDRVDRCRSARSHHGAHRPPQLDPPDDARHLAGEVDLKVPKYPGA